MVLMHSKPLRTLQGTSYQALRWWKELLQRAISLARIADNSLEDKQVEETIEVVGEVEEEDL